MPQQLYSHSLHFRASDNIQPERFQGTMGLTWAVYAAGAASTILALVSGILGLYEVTAPHENTGAVAGVLVTFFLSLGATILFVLGLMAFYYVLRERCHNLPDTCILYKETHH